MSEPRLSLTGRRWIDRGSSAGEYADIPTLITALRANRKLGDAGVVDRRLGIRNLSALPKAVDRLSEAIRANERIAIFGDYDCDGITSTAMLARLLHRRGIQPLLILPHRLHDGYGLKAKNVDELLASDITLLITADTGVSAISEIARLRDAGIDTIVIDHHHLPEAGLPPAYAILHPGVGNDPPLSPPSAAGVAWEFVDAFERHDGNDAWNGRDEDLALATMGTVADLVDLKGGNRALVEEGLRALGRISSGPLSLLKMQAGITGEPKSTDIAFRIAPRINAAGRMADPSVALNALLGDELAMLQLDDWNRERQTLVASLANEALERAKKEDLMICLADPRYVPGICGLISGKVTEKLGRPSLVAYANPAGTWTASLRSIAGFHVTEALGRQSDLLTSFGGHAMAAGCSFEAAVFPELRTRLSQDVREQVRPELLVPSLFVDCRITPRLLSLDLCRMLDSLQPFGQGNPEPSFLVPSALFSDARVVGKDRTHLQARVGQHKLIGFGFGSFADQLRDPHDIVVHLGIDTWQGNLRPQLYLQDIRETVQEKTALRF